MKHEKKRSKFSKRKIAISVIIIIIVFIICFKISSKKDIDNTENSENEFVLYNSSIADYVKQSEDGTKINISPKINQDMKLNELDIKNIQLTCKNGITTLLADVSNNTNKDSEMKNIKIKFLDENNKEIRTVSGYIPALKIGETTKLNVSMSSNLIIAYDIEFSEK